MAKPDLSEFQKYVSRSQKKPCQVAAASANLKTDGEREQLVAACAADTVDIPTGAICRWLEVRGQKTSPPGVTSHRRGTCTCDA